MSGVAPSARAPAALVAGFFLVLWFAQWSRSGDLARSAGAAAVVVGASLLWRAVRARGHRSGPAGERALLRDSVATAVVGGAVGVAALVVVRHEDVPQGLLRAVAELMTVTVLPVAVVAALLAAAVVVRGR